MKLLLVTQRFPFHPGEQFLEDEVRYLSQEDALELVIAPVQSSGTPRITPPQVEIEVDMYEKSTFRRLLSRLWFTIQAVASPVFRKEVAWLSRNSRFSPIRLLSALAYTGRFLESKASLAGIVEKHRPDIIYTYWHDVTSYAAVTLKGQSRVRAVISRIHGFDLYEERMVGTHQYLKRQFAKRFDAVFCLSSNAKDYYSSVFGAARNLSILPIGVKVPESVNPERDNGIISLVSCSYCVQVKRIDRIIETMKALCLLLPDRSIQWTHIGEGPLFSWVSERAREVLEGLSNLSFDLLGHIEHTEVHGFYQQNHVTAFVNLSTSEGVPVSLMEAMSYGIPAVAPNVGGISSLVIDQENGRLLPEDPSPKVAAEALCWIVNLTPEEESDLRKQARETISSRLDTATLYPELFKKLREFADG